MEKQKHKKRFYILAFILFALGCGLLFGREIANFLKTSLFVDYTLEANRIWSQSHFIEQDIARYDAVSMDCDVVVVGGGSGGVAAAIQSARMGVDTCLIEETDWLGGMLTSAGVSAIDGRTDTPSGAFKEFIEKVRDYYRKDGREDETKQCSVSYFCFEPRIGDMVFKEMAKETPNLRVFYNSKVEAVYKYDNLVTGIRFRIKELTPVIVKSKVVVDATEFGDLMYLGGIPYDLGPDIGSNEPHADEAETCIQPLTYVAILKQYDIEVPVEKPANYVENNYKCTIKNPDCPKSKTYFDLPRLFTYGKLPDGKIMINVPSHSYGNDFHATADHLDSYSRKEILQMSKDYTQGLIYYLQNRFNLKDYGIYNEFGSVDGLAKMPYVRESRRLKGVYRMDEWDILPDKNGNPTLFKNSIAIGDYPIDLHFCEYGKGDIFYEVSPYQIPYEVTIPKTIDGFMAAEKNISVTHIVNGTTRLQPVVMSVGQAVGAGAALSVQEGIQPRDVDVSKLQEILVDAGSQVFYFSDISTDHYANQYINKLTLKGVVSAYDPISGSPEKPITKDEFSEFIKDLYRTAGDKIPTPAENIVIDSYFNSQKNAITRSQIAAFLANNIFKDMHGSGEISMNFKDVKPYSYDFYNISKLVNLGIFSTKNSTFRPYDYVTRGEFIAILSRTVDYFDSTQVAYKD